MHNNHFKSYLWRIILSLCFITSASGDDNISFNFEKVNIPEPVLAFVNEKNANQAHPRAPAETQQFGQLAGIWYCSGYAPDPLGKEGKVPYQGYWAWKYILGGYGVQDFFYQGENEYRFWDFFKRDAMLTQLRVYEPNKKQWNIAYINNNGGEIPGKVFGTFTAQMVDNELRMKFIPEDKVFMKRIVFYEIKENSFKWRSESSQDEGKTWVVSAELTARRLK